MNWQLCDAMHELSKGCDMLWNEYMDCENLWFVTWVWYEYWNMDCVEIWSKHMMWIEYMIGEVNVW